MEFKKGMAVKYNTGTNTGSGKIIGIRTGQKGDFYEVKDSLTKKVYALRAAKLTAL